MYFLGLSVFYTKKICTICQLLIFSLLYIGLSYSYAANYKYSNTVSGTIPDGQGTCASTLVRTLNVSDTFTIGDVNVGLVVDHAYKSDLVATLTSPTGTVSNIVINVGGGADDFNVLLDDQTSQSLGTLSHDAVSTYPQYTRQPSSLLSVFNNESANGIWTLSLCDQSFPDNGTFYRFELNFMDSAGGVFNPPSDAPATGTIINNYAAVTSLSGAAVGVDSTAGFTSGDTALLIQMKGAMVDRADNATHGDITSYGNAGQFEFVNVASVGAGSITLESAPTVSFNTTGVVQLVRVAKYTDQTLSGTVSASPWTGTKGGIVAIDATDTLTLAGTIDVTGLGFMGGALATEKSYGGCVSDQTNYSGAFELGTGNKGEGIVVDNASHRSRRGHNANGGGGGNITDAGGGGGANYGAGGLGGRELDLCDNDGHFGGLGGQKLDYSSLDRLFLGGGGGSGSEVGQVAVGGPRTGGGIVIIRAKTLVNSGGRILANGLTANNDDSNGADGGGAAGAVAIAVNNSIIGMPTIEVQGGAGGSEYNVSFAHGTGGGGGGGAILLNGALCTEINWSADEGKAGTSQQGAVFSDPNWGATDGQPGGCLENVTNLPVLPIEPDSSCIDETKASNEIGIFVKNQIKTNDLIIVPSREFSPSAGYLKAFQVDVSGDQGTLQWDASTEMSASRRLNRLYTSDSSNNLIKISELDQDALGVDNEAQANIVKNYTIDPSFSNGKYLGERKSGSFLGSLSRGNDIDIISNAVNAAYYFDDADYRTFTSDYLATRKEHVLFSSDDGFLYNVDYKTGQLSWGWMPKGFLKSLKGHQQLGSTAYMQGDLDVLDLKDQGEGSYHTYVVGSYRSGAGFYVLQLDKSDSTHLGIGKIVWDSDEADVLSHAVGNGKKAYFSDKSGNVYAIYVVEDIGKNSFIKIRSITDASVDYTLATNKNLTSIPYVISDYQSRLAPIAKTLYLGTKNGEVLTLPLLTHAGSLKSESQLGNALINNSPVLTIPVEGESGVTYIGSMLSLQGMYFLRVQTSARLTVYRYDGREKKWNPYWTTFVQGSGKWIAEDIYKSESGAEPVLSGKVLKPPKNKIQALPENARITGEASVLSNTLVLPVTLMSDGAMCNAYHFFYSLQSGMFPATNKMLHAKTKKAVENNVYLGVGRSSKIVISDNINTNRLIGYGSAEQLDSGEVGVSSAVIFSEGSTSGVRSWRILD